MKKKRQGSSAPNSQGPWFHMGRAITKRTLCHNCDYQTRTLRSKRITKNRPTLQPSRDLELMTFDEMGKMKTKQKSYICDYSSSNFI